MRVRLKEKVKVRSSVDGSHGSHGVVATDMMRLTLAPLPCTNGVGRERFVATMAGGRRQGGLADVACRARGPAANNRVHSQW